MTKAVMALGKIIAIDFDGCLAENRYPEIGEAIQETVDACQRERDAGSRFILWTCRTGDWLQAALDWCAEREIAFAAVNENVPERIEKCGGDTRKVSADEYWDDRAVKMPAAPQAKCKEMKYVKKSVHIDRGVYAMEMPEGGQAATITMYGEIVERRPVDFWTGEPIEGDFIIQSEFLKDLEAVAGAKNLTIRVNSLGGDVGVSILIHNRLRELAAKGTNLTCIVDGAAMSGGSHIMCACDTVKMNPASIVMIHKCWSTLFGGYNADELREMAASFDAWDKAQASIYKRKTGLSETVLTHMMSGTTYMTGAEAVEKGFADELMEDAEPAKIAASADGGTLYVNGRALRLAPGMFAPDSIPTVQTEAPAPVQRHAKNPLETGGQNGGSVMTKNLEEPRQNDPVLAERKRLEEIDAVAALYDDETVREAKYGEHPCTAQEMTYQAAQKAVQQGKQTLKDMETDTAVSGAAKVKSVVDPALTKTQAGEPSDENKTEEQRRESARALVKALLGKGE